MYSTSSRDLAFEIVEIEYSLLYRSLFAKEIYFFREPTNRSHPISILKSS